MLEKNYLHRVSQLPETQSGHHANDGASSGSNNVILIVSIYVAIILCFEYEFLVFETALVKKFWWIDVLNRIKMSSVKIYNFSGYIFYMVNIYAYGGSMSVQCAFWSRSILVCTMCDDIKEIQAIPTSSMV